MIEQLLARSPLHDAAGVHHGQRVRHVADHREVVRDEHVGEAEIALQPPEQVQDLRSDRDVQRRDRLVEDDETGLECQGSRDPDPLALPA